MPYDPSGYIFKKLKILIEKIHAPSVCYNIIYSRQDMEAASVSMNRQGRCGICTQWNTTQS